MINLDLVTEKMIDVFSNVVDVSVVENVDMSHKPERAQVVVKNEAEAFAQDAFGFPFAFQVRNTLMVITHSEIDENGAIRKEIFADICNHLNSVDNSTFSIEGFTCDALLNISSPATSQVGEVFISREIVFDLIYQRTT
jgi:hypothetical protein